MDFSNADKMPDEDKLEKAKQFKQEGNDAYKNKNYKLAIGKYHRALLHLKGIGQLQGAMPGGIGSLFNGDMIQGMGDASRHGALDPKLMSEVVDLKTDCYNNLAACLLQQETPNYEKIIQYCDYVLEGVPTNVKAIYRKGMSLFHLKDYDKAIETLKEAHTDPSIQKYIIKSRKELDEQEKNMKKALSGMFNSKQTDSKVKDTADT
ncbi:tetratricopeptide repeat protein 9C-like [Gigantopelta aegis]|uniref:tetratricopeptide repeat protein 9C-like n=1 Tax=Gigantopelta aegis TaxID=1735272 RepID=UPI001B88B61A|nr:tetratricopeptide repeat protein 9C-like [Gigantopelta aegis]